MMYTGNKARAEPDVVLRACLASDCCCKTSLYVLVAPPRDSRVEVILAVDDARAWQPHFKGEGLRITAVNDDSAWVIPDRFTKPFEPVFDRMVVLLGREEEGKG